MGDVPDRHPAGVKADDDVIQPGGPARPLGHQVRCEGPVTVPRNGQVDVPGRGPQRLRIRAVAGVRQEPPDRVALVIAQMPGQLGLQPAFQRGLDQLLDKTVLAIEFQLPGIDLGHQFIERAGGLQSIHAPGGSRPAGQLLRQHIMVFSHGHNDSPINQRLQPSYTNNLTPPHVCRARAWPGGPSVNEELGAAVAAGEIAATIITLALDRVRHSATPRPRRPWNTP